MQIKLRILYQSNITKVETNLIGHNNILNWGGFKPILYHACMSPVSPVFHTLVTVSIGLKNVPRVRASIL